MTRYCIRDDASPHFCSDIAVWLEIGNMEWGGRREEGSGWGTHVYLWRIHFDIWQN